MGQVVARETVTGWINNPWQMDNGSSGTTLLLYVQVGLDEGRGAKGFRTLERKVASVDVIKTIEHLPLPFQADVQMEERASRKGAELFAVVVKPLVNQKVAS